MEANESLNKSVPPDPGKDIFRTSRAMYIILATFEYLVSIITTGAFLAKLTTTLGISDSMTAILSTVTSLTGSFQVIAIFLSHKRPYKRWIFPLTAICNLSIGLIYAIPFMRIGSGAIGAIFFALILISNITKNIFSPARTSWYMDLVKPSRRGMYSALLTIFSLIGGIVFTYGASRFIDIMEAKGEIKTVYVVFVITIVIFTLIQLLCLLFSKEKQYDDVGKAISPISEVKSVVKNKKFMSYVWYVVLSGIVTGISNPFLGTYQINDLGFSMTTISTMSIVGSFIRMGSLTLAGRFSTRIKPLTMLKIYCIFPIIEYVIIAFSSPANGLTMFWIYNIILSVGSAYSALGSNILYQTTHSSERTTAIALYSIIAGIVGFTVTLLSSFLFDYVSVHRITIKGTTLYPQQVLCAISAILMVFLNLYIHLYMNRVIKSKEGYIEEDA